MTIPKDYDLRENHTESCCDTCDCYSPKVFPKPTSGKCFLDYKPKEEQYTIHWVSSLGLCPSFRATEASH